MSNCSALFAPFWINSFFESSYFNIPNFILPEQHLWHIKSLIKYVWDLSKIKENSFLLYNLENYTLDYDNEKKFIDFLAKKYSKLLDNKFKIKSFDSKTTSNIVNKLKINKYINKNINKFLLEAETIPKKNC